MGISAVTENVFRSGEQVITASSTITVAHGLGATPRQFWAMLICKTAEVGYSIGDEMLALYGTGGGEASALSANATNLVYIIGAVGELSAVNKTTRGIAYPTYANWKIILRWKP